MAPALFSKHPFFGAYLDLMLDIVSAYSKNSINLFFYDQSSANKSFQLAVLYPSLYPLRAVNKITF